MVLLLVVLTFGCAGAGVDRPKSTLTPDLQAEQACVVREIAGWHPSIAFISAKCSRGLIVERTEPILAWLLASPKFRAKYPTATGVLAAQMRELDAAISRTGDPYDRRFYVIGESPDSDALGW